jgi:hypothetical protein
MQDKARVLQLVDTMVRIRMLMDEVAGNRRDMVRHKG